MTCLGTRAICNASAVPEQEFLAYKIFLFDTIIMIWLLYRNKSFLPLPISLFPAHYNYDVTVIEILKIPFCT
jgi:hypothetical protein